MKTILFIALGGAMGAVARYGTVLSLNKLGTYHGILLANILGCFLIGLSVTFLTEKWPLSQPLELMIAAGFLGAYTTFSAFSLQAWQFIHQGECVKAMTYIVGSVIFSLGATALGMRCGILLSQ